jgi:hypothetical protein
MGAGRVPGHQPVQGANRIIKFAARSQIPELTNEASMGCHQPTRDYAARRTADGRTKHEIMRCLKRYIAREVFPHLLTAMPGAASGQP